MRTAFNTYKALYVRFIFMMEKLATRKEKQ